MVPYRYRQHLVTDDELAAWGPHRAEYDGSILGVHGPCPNCRHTTELSVERSVMARGQSGELPALAPTARMTRICHCACGQEHPQPGAAEPAQNCGSWWLVTMALDPDVTPAVRAATDSSLLPALRAVQEVTATEEATLRSSAEKWIAAVTALLGLFGLAGVVVGKDAFVGMSTEARVVAGIFSLVAIAGAAGALVLAYKAAYGWPVEVNLGNDHLLTTWFINRRERLKEAARQLRCAVVWALCSLGALVVALGCIWFWPRSSPAGPLVEVTRGNDSKVCGTLLDSKIDHELRMRLPNGEVELFGAPDMRWVKNVGSCPS
ncbi:hypothetical protein PV721_14120 [Streptomyces sp. MB09-01]|uniref:hypothetical protein n=1 Tax=Streptomyces sp. MB09-01 TaxID=3028666 RepID=UPI0029BF345F|nr:hypothetical protein [Streptomyces sp. MB09-01]MDX3535482.1 hypothetical protein [Streptomyces sp. MB09-01]